jgi:hypothetical protein
MSKTLSFRRVVSHLDRNQAEGWTMQPDRRLRHCNVRVVGADNLALESVMGERA